MPEERANRNLWETQPGYQRLLRVVVMLPAALYFFMNASKLLMEG